LDGWSVAILMSDIFRFYIKLLDGFNCENEVVLNSDISDFIRNEINELKNDESKSYWKNALLNVEECFVVKDKIKASVTTRMQRVIHEFSHTQTKQAFILSHTLQFL